jgi:AhpD family alkylhydroperoxidase
MIRGSGVSAEIDLSNVPVFAMVPECIHHEVFGGAVDRNQAYAMSWVQPDGAAPGLPVLYDPQTSGGLLVALPPAKAEAFVDELRARGNPAAAVIGRIVEKPADSPEGCVRIVQGELGALIGTQAPIDLSRKRELPSEPERAPETASDDDFACCESPPTLDELRAMDTETDPETAAEPPEDPDVSAFDQFQAFMKEANKPGSVDAKHKKLMAIALSIAHHCEPCLRIHLKAALQMGVTSEELEETAALATSFGGCTSMMFYKEVLESQDGAKG